MPGTHVRRYPAHACTPWRLVVVRRRRTLRMWAPLASLTCLAALALLAAVGPLLMTR